MEYKQGKRYHHDNKFDLKKRRWTTYKEIDSNVIEYSTPMKISVINKGRINTRSNRMREDHCKSDPKKRRYIIIK